MDSQLHTLLPKKLEKGESAYRAVKDLADVLEKAKESHIRNVAVSGPFGSGKSSVITTLMTDFKNHTYLPISLATLRGDEEKKDENADEQNEEHNNSDEKTSEEKSNTHIKGQNEQVEYSILQQIIYKEKAGTLPNSRFRKITHYSKTKLCCNAVVCVITVLAFFILFEPSFARVYSLCRIFDLGNVWNTIFDFISMVWLIYVMYCIFRGLIKSYGNSKMKRLNIIDGEIEIAEEASIFNKHLDEILYFFQVTNYDVVIIEDLDRFNPSADIFLKLRELNQLINESKIVGRHITFVYAIKDDVFKELDRTKFFDYIITVIPVINHSNSKDILKKELCKRDFDENEISDDDLSEIAFFITDMRMLINIVNEYGQYRKRLCRSDSSKLNLTQLLAMITYKNYYPRDFDELQYRKGKVYTCISKKNDFIKEALKDIEQQKEKLEKEKKLYKDTCIFHANELRLLFLYRLRKQYNERITQISIGNKFYSLEEIAEDDRLFKSIREGSTILCKNIVGGAIPSIKVDMNKLDTEMNLSSRLSVLENGEEYYESERRRLGEETIAIKSLRLSELLSKYITEGNKLYSEIGLEPMQDIFIRRGYIDEDYYDYVSYFYAGTLSFADRDLLLSIKQQITLSPDYHIDKKENFVKELRDDMFANDAILNNDLLDYLAEHREGRQEKFGLIMRRIERKDAPLEFLAQYYTEGKQQKIVFEHFINSDKDERWRQITEWKDKEERDVLTEAYLRFCNDLQDTQQEWLNNHYSFVTKRVDGIGLDRCLVLVSNSKFTEINSENDSLLDCVIEYDSYKISSHNLCVVAQTLCKGDKSITEDNLNYTRLHACQNESLKNYIDKNIQKVITCIKDDDKDESVESILFIINNENIDSKSKEEYLSQQRNQIPSFNEIEKKDMYDIAVRDYLIVPTWENVTIYFDYNGEMTADLAGYINDFASELSKEGYTDDKYVNEIFVALSTSNIISPKNYGHLLKSFSIMFPDCNHLKSVDMERLHILIENGKIAFGEDTIKIMNDTPLLAEYLIYYSREFIKNMDLSYKITENVACKLLESEAFSLEEKVKIIEIIHKDVRCTNKVADLLIPIYIKGNYIDKDTDVALFVIKRANKIDTKVKLAVLFIKANPGRENISSALKALGGEYSDITKHDKHPKLDTTNYNVELLEILKDVNYISSFKEEKKDKGGKGHLRVYPKNEG
ncbi:MAG: ATP-binding protein [Prevotella sp.]|nr:ATP-binding protein [Prevotella sp.]